MLTVCVGTVFKPPIYFFLNYVSFVNIYHSSVIAPKMIVNLLAKSKTISCVGCMLQLFGVQFFGCTKIFIITIMAYDCYVAIDKPLHYMTIMDQDRCNKMLLGTLLGEFLHSFIQVALVVQLPFCGSTEIDHSFCDVHPVLKLPCTDTYVLVVVGKLCYLANLLHCHPGIPEKAVSRRQAQSSLHLWLPRCRGHHLWPVYFHVHAP
ncbi:olfactory receptor 4S2-like [Loxodonta africana]|uniref:olfactory receptor 4S2-like n=1 Tax=Loxodonta africana TaxID=9785 RepID=UPI0030D2A54D